MIGWNQLIYSHIAIQWIQWFTTHSPNTNGTQFYARSDPTHMGVYSCHMETPQPTSTWPNQCIWNQPTTGNCWVALSWCCSAPTYSIPHRKPRHWHNTNLTSQTAQQVDTMWIPTPLWPLQSSCNISKTTYTRHKTTKTQTTSTVNQWQGLFMSTIGQSRKCGSLVTVLNWCLVITC